MKRSRHSRRPLASCTLALIALGGAQALTAPQSATAAGPRPAPDETSAAPDGGTPKSVLDLQPFRQAASGQVESDKGVPGTATLINLDPSVNARYVLAVTWRDGSKSSYDLENPQPGSQSLVLNPKYSKGIELVQGAVHQPCKLFGDGPGSPLAAAGKLHVPFASLCEGKLFLRNAVRGHTTALEAQAEFVRTKVWGGEKVTVIFHHLLGDTHRETAELRAAEDPGAGAPTGTQEGAPPAALVDPKYADQVLTPTGLGLALDRVHAEVRPGAWYAASDNPGVYVSLIEPQFVEAAILSSYKATVNALDSVEGSSLCYLVAFDLDRFNLGYALGTQHPSVEWSEHIQPQMRDPRLPGPDGIGTIAPLVSTGLISPELARITVATFAGGFKRMHGAFKSGPLATVNHGSHYGFMENGVVFSTLQPRLSTVFVLNDGSVRMKTWEPQDSGLLGSIRHARQSGVPLVEFDERTQSTVPGPWVNQWGAGNWSGSENQKLRTMRAAVALQVNGNKRFLIFAVFSDATPSAMARVFQAYRCRYAMHLDMNALEHSYFALYRRVGSQLLVEYLIDGMSEVDKMYSGETVPRFLGYPDNRDFFYVTRRSQ